MSSRADGPTGAYGYFDHDADIGIVGRGRTIEEAFVNAARAMFSIPYDLQRVTPEREIAVSFDEPDPEFALVEWLNALLAASRVEGIVPAEFELRREGSRWVGRARGMPLREDMERGTEVKGATLTALSVAQQDGGWEARCVVDV
ncbi:MAG: archease [Chloroflexota bacterium]|nr:archease [Dehalococcoidia bacterium]MDW8046281.1 archease [Chloroflexota bacterium]